MKIRTKYENIKISNIIYIQLKYKTKIVDNIKCQQGSVYVMRDMSKGGKACKKDIPLFITKA
jgi:hypothetical protein